MSRATAAAMSALVFARFRTDLVVAFGRFRRDRIAPAEPAGEVDIGAELRAKWLKRFERRFATDRTGARAANVGRTFVLVMAIIPDLTYCPNALYLGADRPAHF
jgi:nicotinamide mononucleotide (NMN) deamidase PncC